MTSHHQERTRITRAELSRMIEPGDLLAGVAIGELGAFETHSLIVSEQRPGTGLVQRITEAAEGHGITGAQRDLRNGLQRWRTRLTQIDGERDLRTLRRFGGGVICPEDDAWPEGLYALGPAAPPLLWWRGAVAGRQASEPPALPHGALTASVVGSREITDYGARVAAEVTQDLVSGGVCVLSGGAYGVDAAVHRAALRTWEHGDRGDPSDRRRRPPTAAILAGGLDRFYPAGNHRLLESVAEHGVVLSEMAPGSAPTRHRFLQRNRLIAALGSVTVVIEARWRSGAQSTAHHALGLDRPVGVVPGSVHSASSAGCHRLLQETPAELVTDASDVVALMTGGSPLPAVPTIADTASGTVSETASRIRPEASSDASAAAISGPAAPQQKTLPLPPAAAHPQDGLGEADRLLLDALPRRGLSAPGKLSEVGGLPLPQVLAGLTRLHRRGLARQVNGHWGRCR